LDKVAEAGKDVNGLAKNLTEKPVTHHANRRMLGGSSYSPSLFLAYVPAFVSMAVEGENSETEAI
jgi:hypothetical protein